MKEKEYKYKKLRLSMVGVLFFAMFVIIIARLYFIQVIEHDRYTNYSRNQYVQKVRFNPTRGTILDRNRTPLAITVPMKSLFASPYRIKDKKSAANFLADELGIDSGKVYDKLSRKKNFVWIKRKITPAKFESVNSNRIPGISFLVEDKRFYPKKSFAARVLGFCGIDNQGLAGVEYFYDKTLLGRPAVYMAQRDAMGRISGFSDKHRADNRYEMVLTLDSNIQYIAEKAVKKAFEKYNAKAALAIVMSTKTGDILAVAEQPGLNPNDFASYPSSRFKSLSVTQSYEPGSTFKIFMAAAALDNGSASPDDKFDCENGIYKIGNTYIREANKRRFGMMTFTEIITHSSNIGSIKIAQTIGKRNFYNYISKFGFGRKTGIDLPGEISGLVRHHKNWSGLSLPSISFGQEINVTPIQLVTALSILGNGGMSVKPHLMKQIARDGRVVKEYQPPRQRRVVSKKAAEQTVAMMRLVVKEGTGQNAYIPGYDIAGKTGTAQKFDRELGKYSKVKHFASFLALFPAYDPIFSILVMVDEPEGKGWGGLVAAPVGKEIILKTAHYFAIPSANDTHYEVDWNNLKNSFTPPAKDKHLTAKAEPKNWMRKVFALVAKKGEANL